MSRISTFKRGGVHPSDKKSLSNLQKIEILDIPSELTVSMSQHLGAPATLLKKKGDRVEKGELIGEASSFISANVHSPVDGLIIDVKTVGLASGAQAMAAVIKCDEEQRDLFKEKFDYSALSSEELLTLIKDMGIVGLGGATFPLNVKLSIPPTKSVEHLVINGVECEPYLTADYVSMLERGEETLEGILIIAKVVNAKHISIGIELNKKDAIEHLEAIIKEKNYPIEVVGLKMKYPQGDEKQLLKAIIKKEIPSGKLPLDIGAVVCNIGTAYAVYESIVYHKPLIERIVTISGEAITEPKNLLVPIGTKVSVLLDKAGGYKEEVGELISGGPMMGFAFWDENTPTQKGTSGILALKPVNLNVGVCVSCAKCVAHCPMGLMPNKMFKLIKNGKSEEAMRLDLMDCKECGSCSYICPAHLPLVQSFKLGKKLGRKK